MGSSSRERKSFKNSIVIGIRWAAPAKIEVENQSRATTAWVQQFKCFYSPEGEYDSAPFFFLAPLFKVTVAIETCSFVFILWYVYCRSQGVSECVGRGGADPGLWLNNRTGLARKGQKAGEETEAPKLHSLPRKKKRTAPTVLMYIVPYSVDGKTSSQEGGENGTQFYLVARFGDNSPRQLSSRYCTGWVSFNSYPTAVADLNLTGK